MASDTNTPTNSQSQESSGSKQAKTCDSSWVGRYLSCVDQNRSSDEDGSLCLDSDLSTSDGDGPYNVEAARISTTAKAGEEANIQGEADHTSASDFVSTAEASADTGTAMGPVPPLNPQPAVTCHVHERSGAYPRIPHLSPHAQLSTTRKLFDVNTTKLSSKTNDSWLPPTNCTSSVAHLAVGMGVPTLTGTKLSGSGVSALANEITSTSQGSSTSSCVACVEQPLLSSLTAEQCGTSHLSSLLPDRAPTELFPPAERVPQGCSGTQQNPTTCPLRECALRRQALSCGQQESHVPLEPTSASALFTKAMCCTNEKSDQVRYDSQMLKPVEMGQFVHKWKSFPPGEICSNTQTPVEMTPFDSRYEPDKISTGLVECEHVKAKIGKALRADGSPCVWKKFPPARGQKGFLS